ncbi:MAG: hypothetical protein IPH52_18045 [Leptospiraceae bacterium]|nr:hypothetical protein [Leptospiraceae bacterium]
MYLSTDNSDKLDKIIKRFEVSLRSFVADSLIQFIKSSTDLERELDILNSNIASSSIILSNEIKSKIEKKKKESKKVYSAIEYSYNSYINRTVASGEVPYISDLIDFIVFFINTRFQKFLGKNYFKSPQEFYYLAQNFKNIRNYLSHHASKNIDLKEAEESIRFISILMNIIEDKYFWYSSVIELLEFIDDFSKSITGNPLRIHNLDNIPFKHGKVIFRDKELRKISDSLLGKQNQLRTSDSLVIFGYGGVGKTALVIEFIYDLIKSILDKSFKMEIDFILFFTGKEEMLKVKETTGEYYVEKLKPQIKSFDELLKGIFRYLKIQNISQLEKDNKKGIIVVDNLETLPDSEKDKIIEFIRYGVPRNIKFIVTSREEENCEERLHLQEFKEVNNGVKFIDEYIAQNDLSLSLNDNEKNNLIKASRGNTLIIVLSVTRLNFGVSSFTEIIGDLNSSTQNMEQLVTFMYANTFERTIKYLESQGKPVSKILKVLSLYDEEMNIHAITTITDVQYSHAEEICNILATRLIVNKRYENFSLNEFAQKFVFVSQDNDIESDTYKVKISEYKNAIRKKMELIAKKKENPTLLSIFDDWAPTTDTDSLCIAEAFSMYDGQVAELRKLKGNKNQFKEALDRLSNDFTKIEAMTNHPYIKYQKARLFREVTENLENESDYNQLIAESYSHCVHSVNFFYQNIKITKSFASVLWIYGKFVKKGLNDLNKSIQLFEESRNIFLKLNSSKDKSIPFDDVYYKLLSELGDTYLTIYEKEKNDKKLKQKILYIITDLEILKSRSVGASFDFNKYIINYKNRIR